MFSELVSRGVVEGLFRGYIPGEISRTPLVQQCSVHFIPRMSFLWWGGAKTWQSSLPLFHPHPVLSDSMQEKLGEDSLG